MTGRETVRAIGFVLVAARDCRVPGIDPNQVISSAGNGGVVGGVLNQVLPPAANGRGWRPDDVVVAATDARIVGGVPNQVGLADGK